MVKRFIELFCSKVDPGVNVQLDSFIRDVLPEEAIEIPADPPTEGSTSKVRVIYEDFGGSVALPHYGFSRPSVDYYQSNLILNNYVIADATAGRSRILAYDERAQGKDGDAMCSLRMYYHLKNQTYSGGVHTLVNARDNCVGQNKSHLTMMFSCLLSITLFQRVVLIFYKTGHSHMMADRVVAWCRNATRGVNLYDADEMMEAWNRVNSVDAEFISHSDPNRPFFVQWEAVLSKYLKKLPSGFTSNYYFEFFEGKCIMRELCSLDTAGLEHVLTPCPDIAAKAMLNDLFGVDRVSEISISKLCLPLHKGNVIEEKKLKSLGLKYSSIPRKYGSFYPMYAEFTQGNVQSEEVESKDGQVESEALTNQPADPVPQPPPEPEFRRDPRGRKSNKKRCLQNLNQNSIIKFLVNREAKDASDELDRMVGKFVEVKFDDIWYEAKVMERLENSKYRIFFASDETSMEVTFPFKEDEIRLK